MYHLEFYVLWRDLAVAGDQSFTVEAVDVYDDSTLSTLGSVFDEGRRLLYARFAGKPGFETVGPLYACAIDGPQDYCYDKQNRG